VASEVGRGARAKGLPGIILGASILLAAATVRAQEPVAEAPSSAAIIDVRPRLHWHDEWPRFRSIGYALTAASVLGALGVTLLIDYPDEPRWSGGILFDSAARNALRARDPSLRDAVRSGSDFTMISNLVQVGLVDGIILPLALGSPRVAAQLSLINAQAFALNVLIGTLLFKVVARERPLGRDCRRDPNFDPLCSVGTYASFPSSHTSTAFTAAGLTCVHHAYLPLYGGGWDIAACVEALTFASATGLFRVIGDRHYVTDVLVGAAIGLGIGYVYPWLFHYRNSVEPAVTAPSSAERTATTWAVLPAPPYGLSIAGTL
jgi:membrane-associated phospholipid phosphatase